MGFNVLVLNLGSTSFKFKYYDIQSEKLLAKGQITNIFSDSEYKLSCGAQCETGVIDTRNGYKTCLFKTVAFLDKYCSGTAEISAIGLKTVMAGEVNYPCIINETVVQEMERYNYIAPAHNQPYIDAIGILKEILPHIPVIGSFETAFHRTIPGYATVYPIDKETAEKYGIRKYGFHGAAHSFVAYRYPEYKRIISVHLGGSSSVCAILNGKSVDTSMGFSPQSGLPMNNRNGDIDVFSVLYLMRQENMSVDDMREFLSKKCGLLGMSGISNDMQKIIGSGKCDDVIEAFAYSAAKYIASFLPALGGIDLISFSGGIGENSYAVKKKICDFLSFTGIKLLEESEMQKTGIISSDNSAVKVVITLVDEELMVARNAYKVLKEG